MNKLITEGDRIYNEKGDYVGTIDRTMASERDFGDDAVVRVVLDCGYKLEYFLTDLSNEEYINRTITLKNIEAK